ncbi:MAG: LolA family protein [Candidatus Acidiferrales bacterium]
MKLRKGSCVLICVFLIGACGISFAAQGRPAWTIETILGQLDSEARSFHSLTADVEWTKVTVVVNDRSTQKGQLFVRGDKMRIDFTEPAAKTILRSGDTVWVYTPKLQRAEEYNLGKHREEADQFLRLGFGTSGKALEKGYLVTVLGEPVLDGKKTVQLELTPKSLEVRNYYSKVQLWIDEASWLPLQQEIFETGTQDYSIIHYTNLIRNPNIRETHFKPDWPKGTQKIKPQD